MAGQSKAERPARSLLEELTPAQRKFVLQQRLMQVIHSVIYICKLYDCIHRVHHFNSGYCFCFAPQTFAMDA